MDVGINESSLPPEPYAKDCTHVLYVAYYQEAGKWLQPGPMAGPWRWVTDETEQRWTEAAIRKFSRYPAWLLKKYPKSVCLDQEQESKVIAELRQQITDQYRNNYGEEDTPWSEFPDMEFS